MEEEVPNFLSDGDDELQEELNYEDQMQEPNIALLRQQQEQEEQARLMHDIAMRSSITPPPITAHVPPMTRSNSNNHYRYPTLPANFTVLPPPFQPPPQPQFNYTPFRNMYELEALIIQHRDLNDSFVAIPVAFITRLKEDKPNSTRPTYGYLIHH